MITTAQRLSSWSAERLATARRRTRVVSPVLLRGLGAASETQQNIALAVTVFGGAFLAGITIWGGLLAADTLAARLR